MYLFIADHFGVVAAAIEGNVDCVDYISHFYCLFKYTIGIVQKSFFDPSTSSAITLIVAAERGKEIDWLKSQRSIKGVRKGAVVMDFFGKFVVREMMEGEVEKALRAVLGPTREEAGCVKINAFRALRGGKVFYIHSTWKDEAAFEYHATLPHTLRFIGRMKELVQKDFEMTRTEAIEEGACGD